MTEIVSLAVTMTVLFFAGPFIIDAVLTSIERWRDLLLDLFGK